MKIKLKKKEIVDLLEKYYKDIEDVDHEVSISVSKDLVGYGCCEHEEAVVSVSKKSTIEILGNTYTTKDPISKEEIKNIFKNIMEAQGFEFVDFQLMSELHTETIGYYMCERDVTSARFIGGELTFNQKNKVKSYIREENNYEN